MILKYLLEGLNPKLTIIYSITYIKLTLSLKGGIISVGNYGGGSGLIFLILLLLLFGGGFGRYTK